MPRVSSSAAFLSAIYIVATSAAGPASADLAPSDVWNDWKRYFETVGYDVSATESASGDQLTITDIAMRVDLPENGGTVTIRMDSVVLDPTGDGAVSVSLAPDMRIQMETITAEGQDADVIVRYTQTAHSLLVSGTPEDLEYSYSAQRLKLALDQLKVGDVTLGREIATAEMVMDDVAATTAVSVGDMRTYDQSMTTGNTVYTVLFTDPDPAKSGRFDLNGSIENLSFSGTSTLPDQPIDTPDVNAMIDRGLGGNGTFQTGPGEFALTFEGPDGSGTVNSRSQGGELSVSLSKDGLAYETLQNSLTLNMLLTELPLPISISAAQSAFNLLMPVQSSDEAQDFSVGVSLQDFKMSDAIWGLFDPDSELPRDPASLVVDLTGKAKVLFDFLDPAQAAVLDQTGAAPGELEELNLNRLQVKAAGAELTGSGAFTFDNSDKATFNGLPKPAGSLDLKLEGGNTLIDKLVAMGLLPEDQAMGVRMMLGLFAVPGDGPDVLTSKIEVNEQGHVLANGQRIQ